MKIIVLADIHGNYEALEAVVSTFPKKGDMRVFCVGDTVGYGADPNKCLELLSSFNPVAVVGNHDAAVVGRIAPLNFNTSALEAVNWTKDHLENKWKDYLSSLPFTYGAATFEIVHGTLHSPEEFMYMLLDSDAMHTFEIMNEKICFVGHSHTPGVFKFQGGILSYSRAIDFNVEDDAKYIVNVGSVGQPRDGDARGCYCVYDPDAKKIKFKRVGYNIEGAQKKILKAGLPSALAERLSLGR